MAKYYFKHTWTGQSFEIQSDEEITICELPNLISIPVETQLNVNIYDCEIIKTGTTDREFGKGINLSSYNRLIDLNTYAFYIRPKNSIVPKKFSYYKRMNPNATNFAFET